MDSESKKVVGLLLVVVAAVLLYVWWSQQQGGGVQCNAIQKYSPQRQECVGLDTWCADMNAGSGWIWDYQSSACIQIQGCSPAGMHCGVFDSSGHCCLSGLECVSSDFGNTGTCKVPCNVGASCTTVLGNAGRYEREGDTGCGCVAWGITNPSTMPPCAKIGDGCGNFNNGLQCCVGRCDYNLGYPPLKCFA